MVENHRIAPYDWVELREPVEEFPAGARGVLDSVNGEHALIEVIEPRPEGMPIVFAPLSALRGLGPERPPARG